jgi:hypothetical protein
MKNIGFIRDCPGCSTNEKSVGNGEADFNSLVLF